MNKDTVLDTSSELLEIEYIFDSKTRKSIRSTTITFTTIGVICLLLATEMEIVWLLSERSSNELTNGALVIMMIGGVAFLYPAQDRRKLHWLGGRCIINEKGIYIIISKKVEYTPWNSIIDIEKRKMNIDSLTNISVICCYKTLAGKTILDHAPKIGIKNPLYKEFYQLRDEVITIGYTKNRMNQIRMFLKNQTLDN